ncbi:hypothetical protein THAOC_15483 [Thalassiosira oceanica]|uniref:Uncharacterized protein n=1 Tax=Thalassiosira oceanica TaxID=159749 RepID=K0SER6_THAOC|nr:hypothetical protein THAOC_15483 [Thalassiosira oceanica]|eukprot:EJK63840.1 hypothetical protein THAOC_15483 [Thalassiosira oceanica]
MTTPTEADLVHKKRGGTTIEIAFANNNARDSSRPQTRLGGRRALVHLNGEDRESSPQAQAVSPKGYAVHDQHSFSIATGNSGTRLPQATPQYNARNERWGQINKDVDLGTAANEATPRPMPQGNLSPRNTQYACKQRTCQHLKSGDDLSS